MKPSSRLFSCVRCYGQTVICSECDRGQIYCSSACAGLARRKSCQAAEKRYQNTLRGKLKHALRQRGYRERLRKKVTDQGSAPPTEEGLLSPVENKAKEGIIEQDTIEIRCCFCKKTISPWFRQGFLRYPASTIIQELPSRRPP